LLVVPPDSSAINPYSAIVERNSFGLKPPPNPADLIKPPPPVVADIKLQGITTILGRKQVLMKVKVPAKPPEPARDQSLVMGEGQREGEVEVLEINPADQSVKVKNGDAVLALNMNDHGEKPTPGASAPTAGAAGVSVPNIPQNSAIGGVPSSTVGYRPNAPGNPMGSVPSQNQNVSGFGGSTTANGAQNSFPTRPIRSNNPPGTSNPQSAAEYQNYSPEAQAILIEAQRAQIAPGGFDPLPKTSITPRDRMGQPQPSQP